MQSVGIVIPAFRPDPDRLVSYCREIEETLAPNTIRIEVDAASAEVLAELTDAPAEINAVDGRRGKGAAITAGFDALAESVLAFADGDGSTPATSLGAVIDPIADGEADLAVGSRRHPESSIGGHQTRARRRMGDGFAWIARRVLPIGLYDYQCGAKALSRDAWRGIREHLYEAGFAWDIEVVTVADALGDSVQEVPVEWTDRPGSTVDPVSTAIDLGGALFRARRRGRAIRATNGATHRADAMPLIERSVSGDGDE